MPFFTLNKFALSIHMKQIKLLILLGHYSIVASVSKKTLSAMLQFPRLMALTKKHELSFSYKDKSVIFTETAESFH